MTTVTTDLSLAEMRDATRAFTDTGRPLTAEFVGAEVARRIGRKKPNGEINPFDYSTVIKWETSCPPTDIRVMRALVDIYHQPFSMIERACARP